MACLGGRGEQPAFLTTISVDRTALRDLGKPAVAVIRMDGRRPGMLTEQVAAQATGLIADWKADGVPVRAIEFDYDCPMSELTQYGDLLTGVRRGMLRDLMLSITALPSSMESATLPELLARVDETVLQVHSVINPKQGLFDQSEAAAGFGIVRSLVSAGAPDDLGVAVASFGEEARAELGSKEMCPVQWLCMRDRRRGADFAYHYREFDLG